MKTVLELLRDDPNVSDAFNRALHFALSVRRIIGRHKRAADSMDAAVRECIAERRLVSPLAKPWRPPWRSAADKSRDEAAEHLAVRS